MDPKVPHVAKTFAQAIKLLDDTEPKIRDLIEHGLMDVASDGAKKSKAVLSVKKLAEQIAVIRTEAIKACFRYLRDNLPSDNGL